MAAHKKIALLQQLAPDVAIHPECAALDVIVAKCPEFTFTDALQRYRSFLTRRDAVGDGDFNNNVFWDRPGKRTNFVGIANTLSTVGLVGAYHAVTREPFGQERHSTLWFLKRVYQRYHIDYCFLSTTWFSHSVAVWVGRHSEWLRYSDHAPLLVLVPDNE